MGNCSPKGITGTPDDTIRVLTDSGAVLSFRVPKLVGEVVEDFPGYGIFGPMYQGGARSPHHPLPLDENLLASRSYHLLPLEAGLLRVGVVQPGQGPAESLAIRGPGLEVLPMPRRGNGVWKVKLVIDTKQLEEILSQEVNVEALIERMREAASSSSGNVGAAQSSPKSWKVRGRVGPKPSLSSIFSTSPC